MRAYVTEIGLDDYKKLGLASSKKALIKILGSGELTTAITIHAHKFSKSAVEKIEKAGGKAVVAGESGGGLGPVLSQVRRQGWNAILLGHPRIEFGLQLSSFQNRGLGRPRIL